MNKQKGKNSIGWCDYTSNPIKGLCPVGCPYCYAKGFYHRLHWNPKIRLDGKELFAPSTKKKPLRIFIGSTIEMYHPQIPHEWISAIIVASYDAPQHTYLTLTKFPENLKSIEFPEWWWVGTTVTTHLEMRKKNILTGLIDIRDNIKFISFEPLLDPINFYPDLCDLRGIDWVIIGSMTNPYTPPKKEWVEKIIEEARDKNISIFLKANLKPVMGEKLIQEFPK